MLNEPFDTHLPLISIVTPTRERLSFLKLTIEAIRAQTYRNFELFIVADGHQEDVEKHVLSLCDDRIKYLSCDFAGRPSVARNLGIKHSVGDFVALCDDDDLWLPEKLAVQVKLMQQSGLDFTFTAAGVIDAEGTKFEQASIGYRKTISLNWFLTSLGNNIYPSTIMVRRKNLERAGMFNEASELRGVEDYELFARLLEKTPGYGLKEELVLYRGHSGSIQERNVLPWLRKQLSLQNALRKTRQFPRWALLFRQARVYYWAVRIAIIALGLRIQERLGTRPVA